MEAEPQGINPLDKLLHFQVRRPIGPHSDAIAKRTLSYHEAHAKAEYTHATIQDGTETQTVQVSFVV